MTKKLNLHGGGSLSSAGAAAMVVSFLFASTSHPFVADAFSVAPIRPSPPSMTHRSSLRPRSIVALTPSPSVSSVPAGFKSVRWAKEVNDDVAGIDAPTPEELVIDIDHTSSSSDDGSGTRLSHRPLETFTDTDTSSPDIHITSDMGKGLATAFNFLKDKHAALAATVLLFLSVFMSPLPSNAVMSGGSMGGSFGASSRSSYSAPARSYSSPSYSSGYSRGFSRGYSPGYYSRPSVVINPAPIMPSPFYSPFWAPSYYSRPVGVVGGGGGGLGFIGFVTFFGFAVAAMNAVSNFVGPAGSGVMGRVDEAVGSALGTGVSVAEISVAVDVPNRDDPNSILSVLNRLSNTARTDSRVGMSNLTSQVALELLRRKNQIVASSTKSKHFRDGNKASREFNTLAVKERGKFEREARRYGGVDYSQSGKAQELTQYSPKATMAVVTLLIAVEGDSTKLPVIRSQRDLEEALAKVASDVKVDDCLQSAEILWTPEDRSEVLTMKEIVSDYPELRSI